MLDEKESKLAFMEEESFHNSYFEEKYNSIETESWSSEPENEVMGEEDLALTLTKAWQYYEDYDFTTADELFELALSSHPDCADGWVGKFCVYFWHKMDSEDLLDDEGILLYQKAKRLMGEEFHEVLRDTEQFIFKEGMSVMAKETQNGTYFEKYDLYCADSELVEILRMVANFMEEDELDRFLDTFETNYQLYQDMLEIQKGDPKAMVLADPAYLAASQKCEELEGSIAASRGSYAWVEWWHILIAVGCTLASWLIMGEADWVLETLGFSLHLVPAAVSLMLFMSISAIRGKNCFDFAESVGFAAIPAAVLYLAVEFLIFRMARNLDPSLTWGTMLYGLFWVVGAALVLIFIVLLFDEFKTALIYGVIAYLIFRGITNWLGIRSIDWYILQHIRGPIVIGSLVISIAMTVLLVKKYFETNKKAGQSVSLKKELAQATEVRDQLYAEKLAQLRAPFEGHVAEVYLVELDKLLK